MSPGLGFALGAMIAFGVSDLIYKRGAAAGIDAGEFVMLQAWAFCPGVTLYAWLTGTLELHRSALWGSLAGLFLLVAMYNFAQSLKGGAVSTNAPIFRLNFTLTAALAIVFLGEPLTLAKAVALAGALVAVWLLLAEPAKTSHGKAPHETNLASLIRVSIATVAIALTNLFYKVGLLHGALPETMVSTQAWTFCSLATLLRFRSERRFRITPDAWRYSTLAAVALAAAFVLLMHGLAAGPASVLVPVANMSFVFSALFGAVLFHESLNTRKRLGLAIATAALVLFAVG
jgi:uncharacterized membrane protein